MKAGSTLGILGGTGSRESTMILLLDKICPLAENSGRITIGGIGLRDIDTDYLRKNIGIVLQDPYLFPVRLQRISVLPAMTLLWR